LFLAVGYKKPHTRWLCPKSFFDLYRPADMVLPTNFAPRPTAPPGVPAAAVHPKNYDLFQNVSVTPDMARTAIAAYFACISYIDYQVGRLTAELDRLQLRARTVVVFVSDHGYHLGERGRWSKHFSLYDVVGRVPLIVDAPGTTGRGRSSPRVVALVDLFPTLVQLAGLPAVAGLQGASLVPLLQEPTASRNRPAYSQVAAAKNGQVAGRSVRTARWRYTEWDKGRAGVELYDHQNDPKELRNLAQHADYAAVVTQHRSLLRNGPF
jgi:iduronate 2-sulfatase